MGSCHHQLHVWFELCSLLGTLTSCLENSGPGVTHRQSVRDIPFVPSVSPPSSLQLKANISSRFSPEEGSLTRTNNSASLSTSATWPGECSQCLLFVIFPVMLIWFLPCLIINPQELINLQYLRGSSVTCWFAGDCIWASKFDDQCYSVFSEQTRHISPKLGWKRKFPVEEIPAGSLVWWVERLVQEFSQFRGFVRVPENFPKSFFSSNPYRITPQTFAFF